MPASTWGVFLFLISHIAQGNDAVVIQKLANQNTDLSSVIFDDMLLFETTSPTVMSCSLTCMTTRNCTSFTFTSVSIDTSFSPGLCRGHSRVMSLSDVTYPSPGTVFFILDWVRMNCNSNSECREPSSECFAGKCLCTPGMYFSVSNLTCQPACPEAGFHPFEFLAYPQLNIKSHNMDILRKRDTEQCLASCAAHPSCRTVDVKDHTKCFLQNVTGLSVPSSLRSDIPSFVHYQRACL